MIQKSVVDKENNDKENLLLLEVYQNLKKQNLYVYEFNIKNVYIDKLDDIANKYNNTYHSTIRMKPVDVKQSTYIEKAFVIKKVKSTVPWTSMLLVILKEKKLFECFTKKNRKKRIKESLELKK